MSPSLPYKHIMCWAGKLYDSQGQGIEAEFVNFLNNEKVIDLACAAQFMVALTELGNVYYWGKMQVSCLNHWITTTDLKFSVTEFSVGKSEIYN